MPPCPAMAVRVTCATSKEHLVNLRRTLRMSGPLWAQDTSSGQSALTSGSWKAPPPESGRRVEGSFPGSQRVRLAQVSSHHPAVSWCPVLWLTAWAGMQAAATTNKARAPWDRGKVGQRPRRGRSEKVPLIPAPCWWPGLWAGGARGPLARRTWRVAHVWVLGGNATCLDRTRVQAANV